MSMYETILLIMGVVIVFLGTRIFMKVRELSRSSTDEEEERAAAVRASLTKDLQELNIEQSNLEDRESPPAPEQKTGDSGET
ncbi:MAG: hypothetical protein FJ217_08510 [Ignavibacteria bacterium]|nr:hypothetical protein [Ignavibacteria bacterium]